MIRTPGGENSIPDSSEPVHVDGGWVAPGFEGVRAEFHRNFVERGEIGAAVAAYWRGERVVDLWGGRRTPTGHAPWTEETMVVVNSTTKGLAAMTVAVANSRGWIDYDAPVAEYWPEFAQNGKGEITVRQLLSHEAGLVWIDESLGFEDLRDLDSVSGLLARQKPAWEPGTRHGYHAMTIGLYMQELIRHVDPAHRTLGRFFDQEIAQTARDRVLHRPSGRRFPTSGSRSSGCSLRCARSEHCPRFPRDSYYGSSGRGRCCDARCCSQIWTRTIAVHSRSRSRRGTA